MNTIEEIYLDEEEYRDSIATVDSKGKRLWVYPKKPKGSFHTKRIWFSIFLLTLFFVGPFLQLNNRPFLMFNIFERKFILFGNLFLPQDFHLVALALITMFVFVILFTVIFGRLWCGWACPQTLFMEMVFRKIEYWIEGDASQQRKLNARPWDTDKILRKTAKQIIFIIFSIVIAHTAMAYLISVEKTIEIISKPPTENWAGFLGLSFFTFLFYGVFAYLREQACIAVCPYGRLQGVLLSKDSIVISYDNLRGEPRGKIKKGVETTNKQGDCIDCKLCVQVCPTGIDIRNGTQLECVNCTACIDACDEVMEKVEKPKGLIRYASYNNIQKGEKFRLTPRIIGYSLVLLALISLDIFLMLKRTEVETVILRVPGTLYRELPNGNLTNVYNFQIANKTFEQIPITLKLKDTKGKINIAGGNVILLEKDQTTHGSFIIELPRESVKGVKTKLLIEVWAGDKYLETVPTNFLGN